MQIIPKSSSEASTSMENPLSWHKGWNWLHSKPLRGRDVLGQGGGTRARQVEHPAKLFSHLPQSWAQPCQNPAEGRGRGCHQAGGQVQESIGCHRRQEGSSRVNLDDAFEKKTTSLVNIVGHMCCAGLTEAAH